MELEIYSPSTDGFVKEITWNHEEIKKEVAEKVKHYATIVYTDEQIQYAKADLAKLRKFVDALETKRKEIKKQCLAPYEAFEKQMKEIIAIVNEPISMIDRQVKEYSEIQKAEKLEAIKAYWFTLLNENKIPAGIAFDQIFNEKWLNASVNIKTVCKEMNAKLEQIENDLSMLAEMPDFAFEAAEVYKYTLDLNKAIAEGKKLVEMQKRKAEAAMQNPQTTTAPDDHAEDVRRYTMEAINAAQPDRQWISFKAYISTADAMALKEFFTARNIKFESIK